MSHLTSSYIDFFKPHLGILEFYHLHSFMLNQRVVVPAPLSAFYNIQVGVSAFTQPPWNHQAPPSVQQQGSVRALCPHVSPRLLPWGAGKDVWMGGLCVFRQKVLFAPLAQALLIYCAIFNKFLDLLALCFLICKIEGSEQGDL